MFNTNGTYYHSPASDICVDPPCFPSNFLSIERSLASHPLLLGLQHLRCWASHIPVHHHAEDCLLSHGYRREDSDSSFCISLANLLNGMCLWATSLTSCSCSSHGLYYFDVSTSHTLVSLCLGVSPTGMLYIPLLSLRYSISCYGNAIMPKSEHLLPNDIILSVHTIFVPVCVPISPRCLTGNAASSMSEKQC